VFKEQNQNNHIPEKNYVYEEDNDKNYKTSIKIKTNKILQLLNEKIFLKDESRHLKFNKIQNNKVNESSALDENQSNNLNNLNKWNKENKLNIKSINDLNKLINQIKIEIASKDFLKKINFKFVLPTGLITTTSIFLLLSIAFSLEVGLIFLSIIFTIIVLVVFYPKIENSKIKKNISKEIPYGLRQMVTELKSGKGLFDTMNSIANSNYNDLSNEFSIAIEEIRYGETLENSLLNMSKRVKSESLNRVIYQIINTSKTGGNLANTLNLIAEDVSYEIHNELKEYSQKLNGFIMIYTFLAILAPVILLIMLIAASTVMGEIIPPNLLLIIYIVFFPLIVVFMGILIKQMEPSI
ncbi:MAG: type II secretion system F family protein, partial [Methanobrevibacter sp.]|nr:type II secretion system F family protein [Methanobrevibacter sp.]